MLVEKLLDSLLEEELAKEPQPEKKRGPKFHDPLAKFPLGKQEIADREDDSHIGRMLTKNDCSWF